MDECMKKYATTSVVLNETSFKFVEDVFIKMNLDGTLENISKKNANGGVQPKN